MSEGARTTREKRTAKPGSRLGDFAAGASAWGRTDTFLALFLVANLGVMGLILAPHGPAKRAPVRPASGPTTRPAPSHPKTLPGVNPIVPRRRFWDLAWKAAEAGDYAQAIELLQRLLVAEPRMAVSLRRTVYLQLAHFYGLAGRYPEMRKYLRLAEAGVHRALIPADLWNLGEEATALGDYANARRYYARFLLQEAQIPEKLKTNVPLCYLRLADGYRNEAMGGDPKARETAADQTNTAGGRRVR